MKHQNSSQYVRSIDTYRKNSAKMQAVTSGLLEGSCSLAQKPGWIQVPYSEEEVLARNGSKRSKIGISAANACSWCKLRH